MGVGFGGSEKTELGLSLDFTALGMRGGYAGMAAAYLYFVKYKAVAQAETFEERHAVGTANTYDSRVGRMTKQNQQVLKEYLKTVLNKL